MTSSPAIDRRVEKRKLQELARGLIVILLATLVPASAAPASEKGLDTLVLEREVRLVVKLERDGITAIESGDTAATATDRQVAEAIARKVGPTNKPVSTEYEQHDGSLVNSQITLRFVTVSVEGGSHSMLVVENGYERGLVYRASLQIDGRRQSKAVCPVQPRTRGYAAWPYPVDHIELTNLRLVAWKERGNAKCT
jgi:hypothetical protein